MRFDFYVPLFCLFIVAGPTSYGQTLNRLQTVQVEDIMDFNDELTESSDAYFDLPAPAENFPKEGSGPVELSLTDDDQDDLGEPVEETDEAEQKQKVVNARQRATYGHLQRLFKPVKAIQLSGQVNRVDVPVNQAALISDTPARVVTAIWSGTHRPERYSVCLSHRPLYFEDTNLERCGQGHGCAQNAVSAVHFISDTLTLPYHLATQRADCLVQSKGDCKSCQSFPGQLTKLKNHGFDRHGVVTQVAALAGFSFLLL